MDYEKVYNILIDFRKRNLHEGYTEKHHIQMRSLGGSDDDSNCVRLTASEHYVAHLLLAKFNRCSQTAFALWMMGRKSSKNPERDSFKSSRSYEWTRKQIIEHLTGRVVSEETREKSRQANLGKKASVETRKKMSDAKKGKKRSTDFIQKLIKANTGRKCSPETKEKMRQSHLKRRQLLNK